MLDHTQSLLVEVPLMMQTWVNYYSHFQGDMVSFWWKDFKLYRFSFYYQGMERQVMQIKETTCICFRGQYACNLCYSFQCNAAIVITDAFHMNRIGLGALVSGARIISDGMLQAAAEWYSSVLNMEFKGYDIPNFRTKNHLPSVPCKNQLRFNKVWWITQTDILTKIFHH